MNEAKRIRLTRWIGFLPVFVTAALIAAGPEIRKAESDTGPVVRRVRRENGRKVVVDQIALSGLKQDQPFSPWPGVRVTLLSEAAAKKRLGPNAVRPGMTDGWVSEMYEDFESSDWDSKWIKRTESGGYTWGRVRYNPYEGTYCCWCADREASGYPEKNAGTDDYDDNMDAWLEYPNFDTRGCSSGTLSFALWCETESHFDYAAVYFSEYWEGYEWFGPAAGWQIWEYDLDEWGPNQRDLMGFSNLSMVFEFVSDVCVGKKGAFLDNIDLRKQLVSGSADLVISALSGSPASLDQGDILNLNATVMNQGGIRSGETNLKYYLSQDVMITASDLQIAMGSVFALDPNQSQPLQASINIPTNVPDGQYYLGAVVDEADNVYEENETNNTYVAGGPPLQIGSTGVGTVSGAVPSEYFLSDNYPNPFNPSTTIAFGLPENGPVLLRVFDASGRLIRTLVQQDLNAGAYRIVWDSRDESGSAVPSGVYLYDLRAGEYYRAAKMVLMD